MRKIYLILLLILRISVQLGFSQELTNEQNRKFFVQGISVTNTITLNNPSSGVDKVLFYSLDSTNQTIDQFIDSVSTDGFSWTLDMGQLDPKTSIYAQMIIDTDYEQDSIPLQELTIIKKPDWLEKGSVANIVDNGSTISFEGRFPIQSYEYLIPKKTKLIGNKPLSIVGDFIFNVDYDLITGEPSVKNNNAEIVLNLLNQKRINKSMEFDSNCELGKDLNLALVLQKEITDSIAFRSPKIVFPIGPLGLAKLKFDAGFNLIASMKGDLIIGTQNGQFGFIESNGKKTKLVGVLTGIADVKGELDATIATVTASLNVKARFGVGFEYISIPSSSFNPLIGGDLDIYGQICGQILGFEKCKKSDSFYRIEFGDTSAVRGDRFDNLFNVKTSTKRGVGTSELPTFNPQPTFSNRDNELYSVWLENHNDNVQLLFSQLNKSGTSFENTLKITEAGVITNPKIGVLPNGSALITWTQNKYDATSSNANLSFEDFAKGQNIWVAFYDKEQNKVIYKNQLGDDGSADGQANISVGKNNEAIITWLSKNFVDEQSDVMFSKLTENDSTWNISAPAKINTVNGLNSQVNVVYADSINAIAVWINDPDADDETIDNNIVFSEWDGQSWSAQTQQLTDNNGYYNYKNVTLAVNNNKVALGYIGTEYFDNDLFENQLNLHIYDAYKEDWDTLHSFIDSDSLYYFQNPQVSISETGIASLAYQVIEMFPDTEKSDNGELYLYVKDLNKNEEWKEITQNTNLCDTSTFIWDMTAGFGPDNQYYVMTQEYNDNGPVTNPHKGIMFGDPELSMVLRGLKVNNDLTITDIDEPDTKTTRLTQLEAPKSRLNAIYPNPFEQFTTIEFSLYEPSKVQLEVYNYTGTKVATLIDSSLGQGMYKTNFDAGNLPEGIYFTKLTVDGQTSVSKMVLIK
jgi:hypothetical protein